MSPKQVLKLRKALGFTQQQLADLIGCQRHTVARWEIEHHEPKGANLEALKALAAKQIRTGKRRR